MDANRVLDGLTGITAALEDVYRELHRHPELSMAEHRTAGTVADWLRRDSWEVTTDVGGTGVVGLLRAGDGPTVMLRADMDALPVNEDSGLDYASTAKSVDADGVEVPVMHACGHDMHVTWLLGAASLLARSSDAWRGALLVVFQPGEETAQGAQAMIDDGLFERFPKPSVILGQHLMPTPSGRVTFRPGTTQAAADSLEVRMFGRGAHGSMPEASVDPIVMAAATVLRLQTIVSREVAASQAAVVTIGALQAGTKDNVIPDEAVLKLNIRTFDQAVRHRVLEHRVAVLRHSRAAHRASSTRRTDGGNNPVTGSNTVDRGPDRNDLTHPLMTEDRGRQHLGRLETVDVRAAHAAVANADGHVAFRRLADLGLRDAQAARR